MSWQVRKQNGKAEKEEEDDPNSKGFYGKS
jgi:hypothetical protein